MDQHVESFLTDVLPARGRTAPERGVLLGDHLMLLKWAAVVGLALTAAGVLVGFYLPTIAARWGGLETASQEFWLQLRFGVGVFLILAGTGLQVYAAWPR
jgi:hypothetical protein